MSQKDKLPDKLENGKISGSELISLLGKLNWRLIRQKGSHQSWSNGDDILILIAGRSELKPYQIKEAQRALLKNL